jgi:hypothetical protein
MINFFRSLRQNLLLEGKNGKYLKYAFGEVILVVIGILIALQINNWNESRKDKKLVHHYAKGLVRDLKLDTFELHDIIKFHEERILGFDDIIGLKDKDLSNSSINDSLYILFRKYCLNLAEFSNNENTLTQLKSTGDLTLFKDSIKNSIITFEMYAEKVEGQGSFYAQAYINNRNISKKILDYTVFLDSSYFNDRIPTGKKFPPANYTDNLKREFFNEVLMLKANSKNYVENFLKLQLKETEDLITILTREYNLELI